MSLLTAEEREAMRSEKGCVFDSRDPRCFCAHENEHDARAAVLRLLSDLDALHAENERLTRREPTRDEMLAALGEANEAFLGGTIRRCIDCREPVFGGPTRCMRCVGRYEVAQERDTLRRERDEAVLALDAARMEAQDMRSLAEKRAGLLNEARMARDDTASLLTAAVARAEQAEHERDKARAEVALRDVALCCTANDYDPPTHRCVRCDSEVTP